MSVVEIGDAPKPSRSGNLSGRAYALSRKWLASIRNFCKVFPDRFRSHYGKEWLLLKYNYKVFVLGFFFQYVHNVAHNLAYYLHIPKKPLFDLGFAVFPAMTTEVQIVSEYAFFMIVIMTILFALSPFYHDNIETIAQAAAASASASASSSSSSSSTSTPSSPKLGDGNNVGGNTADGSGGGGVSEGTISIEITSSLSPPSSSASSSAASSAYSFAGSSSPASPMSPSVTHPLLSSPSSPLPPSQEPSSSSSSSSSPSPSDAKGAVDHLPLSLNTDFSRASLPFSSSSAASGSLALSPTQTGSGFSYATAVTSVPVPVPVPALLRWSKRNPTPSPVYLILMMARFMGVLVLAQSVRIMCFLVTALPGPNYHCRPFSPYYDPPTTASELLFRKDVFFSCGDLVFSSHTTFIVLCALTYQKYGRVEKIKMALWGSVFIFGCLVISARKHYSIDIIIAWYMVPLLWVAYDVYCPDLFPGELALMEAETSGIAWPGLLAPSAAASLRAAAQQKEQQHPQQQQQSTAIRDAVVSR